MPSQAEPAGMNIFKRRTQEQKARKEPPPIRISRGSGVIPLLTAAYSLVGAVACVLIFSQGSISDFRRFILYLICANVAVLGLRLTAGQGLLPAGFLVMMLGAEELSLPELLFIAFTVALLGELRKDRRQLRLPPLLFAVANVSIGIASAQLAYRLVSHLGYSALFPAPIIASAFVLLFNCGFARTLMAEGNSRFIGVYRSECRPLLPWFVAAAYLAYLVRCTSLLTHVHAGLIALPLLFALDRGYRIWSEAKQKHSAELAEFHQRTLETLSMVIDARDHTAYTHLRRVQSYAKAVGQELGLSAPELEDLRIATLVYDIGKLGVPDHILLKRGSLTAEEWERVKAHPVTGAEMLARMKFPAGVRAIVEAHHERWDGTGYPNGLRAEEIPVGARILSAVDCLDALASDRPFRSALPIQKAMEMVCQEQGKSFDPRIVCAIERRYVELEQLAGQEAAPEGVAGSPVAVPQIAGAVVPTAASVAEGSSSILSPIVSARQETQLLQTLASDLAHSVSFDEVAAAVHRCLNQIVSYDTLAVYVRRGDQVVPGCILGRHAHLFSRQGFPIFGGLSGQAIYERTPVLNGDPEREPSYQSDSKLVYKLQSALAMPLEGRDGVTGALTLYQPLRGAFTRDHLRLLKAVSVQVGLAIESALRYQDAENLAGTDHLTGIANPRSLALHLERELSRASRENSTIGVLVCDLNGFKQVNDRFGHLRGNQVLQFVANGLRETCRTSDYLARMGGDEFVIVVPGLKEELCAAYVQRLQTVAVDAGWAVCGEPCLSMSVGAAIYPSQGHDPESLLAEADRRMYSAKQRHKGHSQLSTAQAAP